MDELKSVTVQIYIIAESDEDAVSHATDELDYLANLDSPIVAFDIVETKS